MWAQENAPVFFNRSKYAKFDLQKVKIDLEIQNVMHDLGLDVDGFEREYNMEKMG